MSAQRCSSCGSPALPLRARHRVRVGQRAGRRLDDPGTRDHQDDEPEDGQDAEEDQVRRVEVQERGVARVHAVRRAEHEQQEVGRGLEAGEASQEAAGLQGRHREHGGDQQQDAEGGVEPQGEHGVRHLGGEVRAPGRHEAGDADGRQDHRLTRDERRRDAPQESLVGHGGDGVALVVARRGGVRPGAAAGLVVVRPASRTRPGAGGLGGCSPYPPCPPGCPLVSADTTSGVAVPAVHVSQRTGRSGRRTLRRPGRSGSR